MKSEFFVDCSHTTVFLSNYARGNENGGIKRIQDFPHECHITKTLSLKCELRQVQQHVVAYAQFELAESAPIVEMHQTLAITYFENHLRSRQNPLLNWIKARHERRMDGIDIFHFNEGGQAGWHYSWKSGRGQALRETKHCLRAYVVAIDPVNTSICRVVSIVSSPKFTIESSRRKAEAIGPDVLVTFSKLFTIDSSIQVKSVQLHILYRFLSSMSLGELTFVQPQIQKQLQELLYKNQCAGAQRSNKRKRTVSDEAHIVALFRVLLTTPVAPLDQNTRAVFEIGVNLLYDIYRYMNFMQKMIFKPDGSWYHAVNGNQHELYNGWIENTVKAIDALLSRHSLTLSTFVDKIVDTRMEYLSQEPVSYELFLQTIQFINPRGYVDPPHRALPTHRLTASWSVDAHTVEIIQWTEFPMLSLLTVMRCVSMLAGFSICVLDSTLHVRSNFEWFTTPWSSYILDGALHPIDPVLPNGETIAMVPLSHSIGWLQEDSFRLDVYTIDNHVISLRGMVNTPRRKDAMALDIIMWEIGGMAAHVVPDPMLDANGRRLVHLSSVYLVDN